MSDSATDHAKPDLPRDQSLRNTIILGIFIVIAAVSHAAIGFKAVTTSEPLYVGTVDGEILVDEQGGVAHTKCNGFRIECFESFVVVYVDRTKEPSWSGDYVLTYPWSRIVHLTLADPKRES